MQFQPMAVARDGRTRTCAARNGSESVNMTNCFPFAVTSIQIKTRELSRIYVVRFTLDPRRLTETTSRMTQRGPLRQRLQITATTTASSGEGAAQRMGEHRNAVPFEPRPSRRREKDM